MTDLSKQISDSLKEAKCKASEEKQKIDSYSTVGKLGWVNEMWNKTKYYLIGILIFLVLVVYYKKQNMGSVSLGIIMMILFLFVIVVIVFNDNKGVVGNAVPFAINPMPPHLGLDGLSNQYKFVN